MDEAATWHGSRPQPRRHCVRWGPSPLPTKERSPQFSAHVYYGQTAPWIKMSLGTEVGLGLRDIALDEDPAPPPLKGHSPQFSANVRCGHTAGWTKMPLGMEVGLGPCLLWPRSPISATAELLLPVESIQSHSPGPCTLRTRNVPPSFFASSNATSRHVTS